MTNDHSAFFGDEEEPHPTIPADLAPYLAAVDEPDEDFEGSAPEVDAESEETERTRALRDLLAGTMLAGPDPSILTEIIDDLPEEEWEDEDGHVVADEADEHASALDAAERDLALAEEVAAVTASIIERAPEHDIDPTLDRVREVLDILGDPQNTYPSIHITGTNGKTSTARMIDALLTEMGMRTGRFTSPHLVDARERISLEGEPISREGFLAAWRDVEPYVRMVDERSTAEGGPRLSFFEAFTVMALNAFAFHPVDAAVVEVGMGGRWDSTNVVDADVAVLTPIDVDHVKWLGSTPVEIAREKAGIIKPRRTVVVSEQREDVLEVILERAREVDALVRLEGRDFEVVSRQRGVGGQLVTVRTPSAVYEDVFVPLLGEHQAHNAAAALVAVEALLGGRVLDALLVERGMSAATSPGRLQVVRSSPTVVVDAAHNPAGARSLAAALEETFGSGALVGVYSAMGDKDVEAVLSELEPVLEHLVVTGMPGERAMPVEELAEVARDVFGPDRVDVHERLVDAVERAAEVAESASDPTRTTAVVVFGSVVLAGMTMTLFEVAPDRV